MCLSARELLARDLARMDESTLTLRERGLRTALQGAERAAAAAQLKVERLSAVVAGLQVLLLISTGVAIGSSYLAYSSGPHGLDASALFRIAAKESRAAAMTLYKFAEDSSTKLTQSARSAYNALVT